jgi:hypothetical protein
MLNVRACARSAHVIAAIAALLLALALVAVGAQAAQAQTHISGEVGETVDPDATNGGFFLRYVGDPAPPGYSHAYQWDNPFILTNPESGAVTFEGTLDLTGRETGDVAMIGLLDRADLAAGNTSFQRGAYIYVNTRANGDVRIGVTDGNAGGEIVQTFVVVPAATADAGPLSVTFTVDGTADPTSCDTPPNSGVGGAGCMTLEIDGFPTLTDSYGVIRGTASAVPEFSTGAIPGWEAFPSGPTGVLYDFTITPATTDPQNKDQCKNGGWESYGFSNQGQCIRFVNTGQDSRG